MDTLGSLIIGPWPIKRYDLRSLVITIEFRSPMILDHHSDPIWVTKHHPKKLKQHHHHKNTNYNDSKGNKVDKESKELKGMKNTYNLKHCLLKWGKKVKDYGEVDMR